MIVGDRLLRNGRHHPGHPLDGREGEWDIASQLPYGDFSPGRYAWLIDNVQSVDPPIPARGRQGLWSWEPNG